MFIFTTHNKTTPGHHFHGHVGSNLHPIKGEYVSEEAECAIDGCVIEDHHCYAFADDPQLNAHDPDNLQWSCSEVCTPPVVTVGNRGDTVFAPDVERGTDLQGSFSIAWLSLIVVGGIWVVAVLAISMECCRSKQPRTPEDGKDFVEEIPGSSTMCDDSSEESPGIHC